jgi:hypothetical protein
MCEHRRGEKMFVERIFNGILMICVYVHSRSRSSPKEII